jgi:hypothetical protein
MRFFCLLTIKPSGYVSFIIGLHNYLKHDCWLLNYSLGNLVVFLIFPHKFGCCCTIQLVSKGDSSGYKVAFMMAFKSSWWAFYPCVAHMANKPLVWRQWYFSSSLFPHPSPPWFLHLTLYIFKTSIHFFSFRSGPCFFLLFILFEVIYNIRFFFQFHYPSIFLICHIWSLLF